MQEKGGRRWAIRVQETKHKGRRLEKDDRRREKGLMEGREKEAGDRRKGGGRRVIYTSLWVACVVLDAA